MQNLVDNDVMPSGNASPKSDEPLPDLENASLARELISSVPPWIISLTIHIAVILVLAVSGFQASSGSKSVEFLTGFEPQVDDELRVEFESVESELTPEIDESSTSSTSSELVEKIETPLNPNYVESWSPQAFLAAFEMIDHQPVIGGKGKGDGQGEGQSGDGAKGDGEGNADFFGIKAKGQTFVYVLDNSGSMSGIRWIQACKEVARSLNSLQPSQKFMVILYNTHTNVMLGQRGKNIQCLEATPENRERVLKWLAERTPSLDTFPLGSVKVAMRVKADAIFLLSDGEFRDGTLEYLRKANFDAEKYKQALSQGYNVRTTHCPIHTIAFKSFVGAPLLRQIAHENNGTFRYVR